MDSGEVSTVFSNVASEGDGGGVAFSGGALTQTTWDGPPTTIITIKLIEKVLKVH